MTVKQIAEAAGVSVDTIQRKAKELFSDSIRARQKSNFTQPQAIQIMAACRKLNFVELPQIAPELPQIAVDRIDRLEEMVEKLCLAVATIPQTIQAMTRQPLQIDFVQEYYSLKAWARRSGFSLTYSEAVNYGRKAVKLSKLGGVEIRDIDDERYGKVHSYHTSVLKKVFEVNHG